MRLVVTWLSSRPLHGGGTYAVRFAFHEVPRWHHLLGVPVALWLGLWRGPT